MTEQRDECAVLPQQPTETQELEPIPTPPSLPAKTFLSKWDIEKLNKGDEVGVYRGRGHYGGSYHISTITKKTPSGQITIENGDRFTSSGDEFGSSGSYSSYKKRLVSIEYVEYSLAHEKRAEFNSKIAKEIRYLTERISNFAHHPQTEPAQLIELRNKLRLIASNCGISMLNSK